MNILTGKDSTAQIDWVSQRASSHYPFNSIQPLKKGLPNSFILDAKILIPKTTNTDNSIDISKTIYISSIYLVNNSEGSGYVIQVTDSALKVSSHTSPISCETKSPDYYQDGANIAACWLKDTKGKEYAQVVFTIGQTVNMHFHRIDLTETQGALNQFCYATYQPITKYYGVTSINQLVGDVKIQCSEGIKITADAETKTITISSEFIDPDVSKLDRLIRVNGVTGQVKIEGTDCLKVQTTDKGSIILSNPCGKPCCSSQTVDASLNTALDTLRQQYNILLSYFQNMATNINYMQANLAALLQVSSGNS